MTSDLPADGWVKHLGVALGQGTHQWVPASIRLDLQQWKQYRPKFNIDREEWGEANRICDSFFAVFPLCLVSTTAEVSMRC